MLVPKLRFKRDDGTDYSEWSNKRFANAFTPLNNNTFSRDMLSENGTVLNIHYGDILVRFGEVCDIQTTEIPKVNADIDTSRFDKLQNGDIVLADTAEDETVGKAIEIYHIGTSKVVSGLHTMACRPTDKYAPKYMGYYINSPTYHKQLLPFMQGIKVTSIGRRNIADTVVYYPYDIEEQQKIADFLSTVDEVITQSEAEVQNLEQQKKSAMQKIFSQELRFKREDGTEYPEWEKSKFADIYEQASEGATPSTSVEEYYKNGTIPFVKIEDTTNKYIYSTKSHITEEGLNNCSTWLIPENSVIFTNGATIGNVSINKISVTTKQGILGIVPKQFLLSEYLYYLFSTLTFQNEVHKRETKGTFATIILKSFNEIEVLIPCLEEQQKIADFLSALDEAINYAKQELDKWKELKKGLLQQMFV